MRLLSTMLVCALAWSGCNDEDKDPWGEGSCTGGIPREISGLYGLLDSEEPLPPEDLVDGTLEAGDDAVAVEYTTSDGSRFRVTYRVTKKEDSRDD